MPTNGHLDDSDMRISRCTVPQATPMSWIDFVDDSHPSVVALFDWISSLAPFAQTWVLGEIDGLQEIASEGGIVDGGEVRLLPIRSDPDIYELRWTLLSKKIRQYHGEPPHRAELLVKLHHHIKELMQDKPATKLAQDKEIAQAQTRYHQPQPPSSPAK